MAEKYVSRDHRDITKTIHGESIRPTNMHQQTHVKLNFEPSRVPHGEQLSEKTAFDLPIVDHCVVNALHANPA